MCGIVDCISTIKPSHKEVTPGENFGESLPFGVMETDMNTSYLNFGIKFSELNRNRSCAQGKRTTVQERK